MSGAIGRLKAFGEGMWTARKSIASMFRQGESCTAKTSTGRIWPNIGGKERALRAGRKCGCVCHAGRVARAGLIATLRVPVIGPLISPLHKNFAEGRRYLFAIERIAFGNPAAGKQRVDRLVVLHRNRQDHFPGGQSLAVGLLPASFSRTRYGLAVAGARVFAGSDIIPARMV
jgi:hypothetical protein